MPVSLLDSQIDQLIAHSFSILIKFFIIYYSTSGFNELLHARGSTVAHPLSVDGEKKLHVNSISVEFMNPLFRLLLVGRKVGKKG